MERNLASAQDVGSCVMFPMIPLMTLLSALGVQQVDWLCGTSRAGSARRALYLVSLRRILSSFSTISLCP